MHSITIASRRVLLAEKRWYMSWDLRGVRGQTKSYCIDRSIYPSISLPIHLSIHLSIYPSTYLSIHLLICLSIAIYLSIYLSLYIYICTYMYVYIRYIYIDIHLSLSLFLQQAIPLTKGLGVWEPPAFPIFQPSIDWRNREVSR